MRYLSLFSGIGGFELGIKQAYESNLKQQSLGKKSKQKERSQGRKRTTLEREQGICSPDGSAPLCVGYSEIDKYAIQIYEKHFPTHKNFCDITKINTRDLPDFDLLVGGFPCQSFSIAGKRGGFKDTRGTLFFEIARIAKDKRPRYLLLENVKGLLSHDGGNTFKTVISTLDELGYDLQWQVLNSKNHGVPQNRERVFIVGHLRGTPRPEVFPFGQGGGTTDDERILAHTLNASDWRGANRNQEQTTIQQLNQPKHSNDRVYGADGISPTLNTMQGGRRQPFIKTAGILKETEKPKGNYLPRERVIDSSGGARAVSTSQNQHPWYTDGTKIRRLTPLECERLQGFPDGHTEGVSDTQRYKTLGNAVTVNVIRDIITKLHEN